MDRLDLRVNRALVERYLEEELRALRGVSRAEKESLLRYGMLNNIRCRLRALMRLSPDAQFRIALAFCVYDDENLKFIQRINLVGTERDHGSHAEFFARVAGYIPAKPDASALPLLPEDPEGLAHDLKIVTERTSKGSGMAEKRAKQIAEALLTWRDRHSVRLPEQYERPLHLLRTMFNTRLAQELRLAGQSPPSLELALGGTEENLDVHKIIREVFLPYQGSLLRDIDTANVCLSLLPTETGERMALEYWKTLRKASRRRMVHRLGHPNRVAAEARRQGPQKALRATAEMCLRSIGLRDHEFPNHEHEERFDDLIQSLGVEPSTAFWNKLLACRNAFHGCLSISELQARRPREK